MGFAVAMVFVATGNDLETIGPAMIVVMVLDGIVTLFVQIAMIGLGAIAWQMINNPTSQGPADAKFSD